MSIERQVADMWGVPLKVRGFAEVGSNEFEGDKMTRWPRMTSGVALAVCFMPQLALECSVFAPIYRYTSDRVLPTYWDWGFKLSF